jgi:Ca-activated chloride channel family protein
MAILRQLFAHPWLLWSLAALPVLAVLALWNRRRRRRALARFGNGALLPTVRRRFRLTQGLCLVLGLALLGTAAAGPRWGQDRTEAAPGRDLVVVLDRSNSMRAETPSRLTRAHRALRDLAAAVQRRGGHRLGLVVFAGQAVVVCPLTPDYDHFRDALAEVEAGLYDAELAPGSNDLSGTRIGKGLKTAVAEHEAADAAYFRTRGEHLHGAQDILLLSDGDDPARDQEWGQGADAAREHRIPVYVVGLGEPERLSTVRHNGQEYVTRLEEEPLQEIARRTHGRYFPAYTRALPLGGLYLEAIAHQPVREAEDDTLSVYQPRYRWLLLPAFVLLAAVTVLPDRRTVGDALRRALQRWRPGAKREEALLSRDPSGERGASALVVAEETRVVP